MQRDGVRSAEGTWTVAVVVTSPGDSRAEGNGSAVPRSLQTELLELTSRAAESLTKRFNDQIVCTAWFESPSMAVRAVLELVLNLSRTGDKVPVTAGIATGHCDLGAANARLVLKGSGLADAAREGQILLGSTTHREVRQNPPECAGFQGVGHLHIEGVLRWDKVYRLTHPGLADASVGLASLKEGDLNNSPKRFGYLVGREDEIDLICDHLRAVRLVTLVGPSGIGKSHLACRAAAQTTEDGSEGVVWVDLDGISSRTQFQLALLQALELQGIELDSVMAEAVMLLRGRGLTVVLDGIDHCRQLAASFIAQLSEPHDPRFILTSATRTGIPGELVVRVRGLSLPPASVPLDLKSLRQFESIELFLDRADRSFSSREDIEGILGICKRLSGNPLAIVLAARRAKDQSPEEILAQLIEVSLGLQPGHKDDPLVRSMKSSVDALEPGPRSVLIGVSFLKGDWTLEDAAALADCSDPEARRRVDALLDAGLVQETSGFQGASAFTLDRAVADYARSRATKRQESKIRERYALRFIGMLAGALQHQDALEQRLHWDLLDWYRRDIAEAIRYTIVPGRNSETFVDAMVLSMSYWYQRNRTREAIDLIRSGLKALPDQNGVNAGRLLNVAGVLAMKAGNYRTARLYYSRALKIAEDAGHKRLIGSVLSNSSSLEWMEGHPERAVPLFQRSVEHLSSRDDSTLLVKVLTSSIQALIETGNVAQAERCLQESKRLLEVPSDRHDLWTRLMALGQLELAKNRPDRATEHFERSLQVASEIGDRADSARSLLWLAQANCDSDNFQEAARFLGAMRRVGSIDDVRLYPTNERRIDRISERVREAKGLDFLRRYRLLGEMEFRYG